ncbi:MAG: serine/threonine protein kinase [Phycisphaerales bacterium]|nr:serine/threonine protein kinase [Phycisphaerales bacterium]
MSEFSGEKMDQSTGAPGGLDWDTVVSIDGYRVLGELGRGAMGVVLLAEQQFPKRQVALKVLRPDAMTPIRERRFELETESLAMLKHPGIAPVYASGRVELEGRTYPYFAMELVQGESLDRYAKRIDRRLLLGKMISICEAVDAAHRRGVLHRDLKPANILVDQGGRARILDFGVAKITGSDTDMPDQVGTLGYMSPEQLRGDPHIDGRCDVYALGVILLELLAGERPYKLSGLTIDDALRVIEQLPWAGSPPSAELGRELDAIIARAIATDPEQRYESAMVMGQDIRRLLHDEPVEAMGGTGVYRARKFVKRNRGLVTISSVALIAIVAGVVGVSWQAARATRGWNAARLETQRAEEALQVAEAQRRRAVAINVYMNNMLMSADPEQSLGSELTVRELLDTSALTLDQEFVDQPDINATLRMAMSNTFLSLGELERARDQAERMLELCIEELGEDAVLTSDAKRTLALVLMDLGQYDRAEELVEQAAVVVETLDDPVESGKVMSERARIALARGDHDRALELWTRGEQVLRTHLGPDHRETLTIMNNRGKALKDIGRLAESEELMRRVFEARIRVFGDDHPQTLVAQNILAGTIQKLGRNAEAIAMLREVVERRRRVLGDDHYSTLLAMGNLGAALIAEGEFAEAEPLTRDALSGYRIRFGERDARTLVLKGNLAYLLEDIGKIDEAVELYRETIESRRNGQGGLDPETWAPLNNLAMLLTSNGRAQEARPMFEELLGMCDAMLPQGHYYTAIFRNNFAQCLIELGELDAAQRAIERTQPVLEATFGAEHERVQRSLARMARIETLRSQR